jgi:predicted adenylyl cyclase CyaB
MRKVIVKTKLHNRGGLLAVLDEIGFNFEPSYWQNDRIFVPKNYDRAQNSPRLSLRTVVRRDGKTIYALVMRQHFAKNGLDVINRTVVEDYAEAAHIIYSLGYTLRSDFSRRREELQMGESVKLYIDNIDGLDGYYLKIETVLEEGDDPAAARQDLIETFKVLELRNAKAISLTYGELLETSLHDVEDIPVAEEDIYAEIERLENSHN